MRLLTVAALAALALAPGCATTEVLPLADKGVPQTLTPHGAIPLEVITRATLVRDPLPVEGSRLAFADLELSLGHAVASATVPWAEAHREQRPDGWQLQVELARARAESHRGAVTVTLWVRAALRSRRDNTFLAQTQTHCQRTAAVAPREAGPLFFDCMARVGRELGGWLGSVEP
jgi:hypothetical protein